MNITLQDLAQLTQGTLVSGDPQTPITGFSSLHEAEAGDVTFFSGNARYLSALKKSRASAVLTPVGFQDAPAAMALIEVANPMSAWDAVVGAYGPQPIVIPMGIHPTAVISPSAKFDRDKVYIGPHAVIEDEVEIGDESYIHAGAFIGHGTRLGAQCVLHANATVKHRCLLGNRVIIHSNAAIGTDGFGYELKGGRHVKIEQVGIVQIDDDVEIGSCTTVDRARFGRTWIGEGSKIDNLVQIGHNVVIGKHSIICAQVGISGSTRVGSYTTMAGQVGVAGHLEIGDQILLLAKSGVTKDIKTPGPYTGYPAKPLMEGRRMLTYPARVPEILERLKALEAKLAALESEKAQDAT